MTEKSKKNHYLSVRIDNLTKDEQEKLSDVIKDEKRKIAPDSRATIVEGEQGQLRYSPKKKLKSNDE